MTELLVLGGIGCAAASGAPGLFTGRGNSIGQWISLLLAVAGALVGLAGVGLFWAGGESRPIILPWGILDTQFSIGVDGLSAFFLAPIFLISLVCNVYGLDYWSQAERPQNGQRLRFFYGFLTAGLALLVIARNSIVFLFGWEIMALSAFFLVITEDDQEEVRDAGWIYLVATHIATVCLVVLFALMRSVSGSFDLVALPPDVSPAMLTAIFVLAFIGFGLKAGVMPFHVWLPTAHAAAPSHVSAMMSGVLIKMGIYGLLRITSLLPPPPLEWGVVVLVLGIVSGILGMAFAIAQEDLKRMLAYCSIENIGIIMIGFGLALIGRHYGKTDWVILGLAGCLLHVWNHALFKTILFLGAGSVIHAVHTRQIDRMGGLAKLMPWTSLMFVLASVAISGLPPLNGFISELFIYLGLLDSLHNSPGASSVLALAAPALAMIGAMSLACFVKVYGIAFLGSPRTQAAEHAHESPASMVGAMGILVVCCLAIGLAPQVLPVVLGKAISAWAPDLPDAGTKLASLAPLHEISIMGWSLVGGLAVVGAGLWMMIQNNGLEYGPTWGCGFAAPTPRIQYTSSSFGQMLVDLFAWVLRPRIEKPVPLPLFPQSAAFQSTVPDAVLDNTVLPVFQYTAWLFAWFRVFQQGSIQTYLLYIFLALIALLLWR